MAPDQHDRALEDWVLAKVAGLDREGLSLGLGVRELPLGGVAEAAAIDERVVGVVLDRLRMRGLVRTVDADPPRVLLTPEGRRGAAAVEVAGAPEVDPSRFVFLRPQAPEARGEERCDFHPDLRKGKLHGGEHCDGSGWIVDDATRESRPCRCRPLRIRRARARRLGGVITPEIRNFALASSLRPELHPALHPVVSAWTTDIERHLDDGRGLWMSVAPWDLRVAQRLAEFSALDDQPAPPRSQEEFEAATARASRLLDTDDGTGEARASAASGALSLMDIQKLAETAAGSAAAAIARAAEISGRTAALYSLSSLYRSLVYLSRFGGYRERIEALQQCDLFILVGLDMSVIARAPDWQRGWLSEQLELIAHGRYDHERATVVVSTGWPLTELERALSPETFHRLSCAAGEPLLGSRVPDHARS
jgi:hypothetical protein